MNNDTAKVLQELYSKKKAKIQELLQITQTECSRLEETDMEELESFLSLRRKIMDEVDRLDTEINDIAAVSTDAAIKGELQALVAQIMKLDEQLKAKLGQEMSGLKQKIKGLRGGKTLKKAYYPQQVQKFGYFIDKKK